MHTDPPNLNAYWAALIVDELRRNGVHTFCLAPGSRNAPLVVAVAGAKGAKSVIHFDERGAAFHALGWAKASGRPVVFICTSGTAAANALPAIVEASMSEVPLIVITADRPPELQDTGANQTIDQTHLYGAYVRWFHELPCPDEAVPPEAVLTAVDQAVYRATRSPAGPVHLNCMFREPLAPEEVPINWEAYTANIEPRSTGPFTRYMGGPSLLAEKVTKPLSSLLGRAARGLVVVGQLPSSEEVARAAALVEKLAWPAIVDAASGLRFGRGPAQTVHYADLLLRCGFGEEFAKADLILHVGGAVTSKSVAAFIASAPSPYYLRVAPHPFRRDPSHCVSHRIEADLESFAEAVEGMVLAPRAEAWCGKLTRLSEKVDTILNDTLSDGKEITEAGVVRTVTALAPEDSVVFLGNSMPIRDADAYGASKGHGPLVAANRGASGIDGNIATAAGYAAALDKTLTAVLGDLATLHDLNSLSLLGESPSPVILIVLNNDGGGIFSFLPIAEFSNYFERFFGTPHGRNFEAIAEGFGLAYSRPTTGQDFEAAYKKALEEKASCLIEVTTDRQENFAHHKRLDEAIQKALNGP